jgi:hypothetical protein
MAHLNDKLADFYYEELPASEMVQARRHVAECGECRAQLQLFEKTHLALKQLPDAEPPRHVVVLEPEQRVPVRWGVLDWRFLAPMAAAVAALVIAIMPASSPTPRPVPVAVTTPAPLPVINPAQAIDYDRIVDQVRQSERAWFTEQLERRDREIRQLQGQLAYYESYQRTLVKETWENASTIQLLAQRTSARD